MAKENKILRVNQCSNSYQRNGSYAGDKEPPFHADGHGIEGLAESLQAGIHAIFLVISCVFGKSLQVLALLFLKNDR